MAATWTTPDECLTDKDAAALDSFEFDLAQGGVEDMPSILTGGEWSSCVEDADVHHVPLLDAYEFSPRSADDEAASVQSELAKEESPSPCRSRKRAAPRRAGGAGRCNEPLPVAARSYLRVAAGPGALRVAVPDGCRAREARSCGRDHGAAGTRRLPWRGLGDSHAYVYDVAACAGCELDDERAEEGLEGRSCRARVPPAATRASCARHNDSAGACRARIRCGTPALRRKAPEDVRAGWEPSRCWQRRPWDGH